MAGLTPEGLTILRLPEVISSLVEAERLNISADVDTDDDNLLGQINNIFSAALAPVWGLSQAVNSNFILAEAEGIALDNIGALFGLVRYGPETSKSLFQMYVGDNGTTVPTTVIVDNPTTSDQFYPVNTVTIDRIQCQESTYEFLDFGGAVIEIDFYLFSGAPILFAERTTTGDVDVDLQALADTINNSSAPLSATVDLVNKYITVLSSDYSGINIRPLTDNVIDADVNTISVGVVGLTEAKVAGPISAPQTSVNRVIVGAAGLTGTYNAKDYVLGTIGEDDESYRARLLSSGAVRGTATPDAIQAAVDNVQDTSAVTVYHNNTMAVDGAGRPPKSYEVFVEGADDDIIAQTIWDVGPAGIETFGNTSGTAVDLSNNLQTINFSRPISEFLAVRITHSYLSAQDQIDASDACVSYVFNKATGDGLLPSELYCPVFAAVEDAVSAEITAIEIQSIASSGTAPNPANWTTFSISPTNTGKLTLVFDDIYFQQNS